MEVIGLKVAHLSWWLDARGSGIHMTLPPCHRKFLVAGDAAGETIGGRADGELVLRVREGRLASTEGWRPLVHPSETWELWRDERGRLVFVAPQVSPPPRHVVVDAGFCGGEVIGEFGANRSAEQATYPLATLGIKFFLNWLAGYGDVILHAAGVAIEGRGYCFAGFSGAGKSTLTAALAETSGCAVLGDDNLVLRYAEGRFWIYGTPWHQDPARCSPHGAPLDKLFLLERTARYGVAPCKPLDGVSRLLQTAFIPYYRAEAVPAILDRLALLAGQVPFYTLCYPLGADVLRWIEDA